MVSDHVVTFEDHQSDSNPDRHVYFANLFENLTAVASDPVRPKKRETVKKHLKKTKSLLLDESCSIVARMQTFNAKTMVRKSHRHETYNDELTVCVTVSRTTGEVCLCLVLIFFFACC